MSLFRSRQTFILSLVLLLGVLSGNHAVQAQSFLDRLKSVIGLEKKTDQPLSQSDIAQGLKEALQVATKTVVSTLGKTDGFNTNASIHIPLPPDLKRANSLLKKIGLGSVGDTLELKLNRAAEAATPKAKALFLQAIKDMTLDDVVAVYKGPEDAATQYFRAKMSPQLKIEMQPVISQSLSSVGAINTYDKFISKYKDLPFVPDIQADLQDFVMDKTLDGIFYYVAKEEAAIRQDPLKQTSYLLQKVFSPNKQQ